MTQSGAPTLTVRYDGSTSTFSAGNDIVVGRDLRADVRVAHNLVSRAHVTLRFEQGRWVAIDNGSLNGIYLNGQRVPSADISDGTGINLGNPDGPRVTFEVGRHQGSAGTPPSTMAVPIAPPPRQSGPFTQPPPPRQSGAQYIPAPRPSYPGSGPSPRYPGSGSNPQAYASAPQQAPPYGSPAQTGNYPATQLGPAAQRHAPPSGPAPRPGGAAPVGPGGSIRIGRATDNDIVIPDVLASRHHATLFPAQGEIRDNRSINGTFVNGSRVDSARLREGDVVTIGGRAWHAFTVMGHAPEHACLFSPEANVLISGDQVLPKITTNVSVWPDQPHGNPLKLYLDSLGRFRPLPESTLVLPSHGLPFRGLHRRLDYLQHHHDERLSETIDALAEPRTAHDLVPVLFRRQLDAHQLGFAIGETVAHLHFLEAQGHASLVVGEDGIHRFRKA